MRPGGDSSAAGTHSISARSTGTSVQFSAKNNRGPVVNITCTSVSGSGTVTSGTGVNPLATISSTAWTGCRGPFGNGTVNQLGTRSLFGPGANATSGTETIAGNSGNVAANYFRTANPAICSFTVSGQMNTSFSESTQTLDVNETGNTGNLVLSNLSGCLGQLQNGNPMNLVATLNVTSPDGVINLS